MKQAIAVILIALLVSPVPALAQPATDGEPVSAPEPAEAAPSPATAADPAEDTEAAGAPTEPPVTLATTAEPEAGREPALVALGIPDEPRGSPVSSAAGGRGQPTVSLKLGEPAPHAGLLLGSLRYAELRKAELAVPDLKVVTEAADQAARELRVLVDECVEEAKEGPGLLNFWTGTLAGAAIMGLSIWLGVEIID